MRAPEAGARGELEREEERGCASLEAREEGARGTIPTVWSAALQGGGSSGSDPSSLHVTTCFRVDAWSSVCSFTWLLFSAAPHDLLLDNASGVKDSWKPMCLTKWNLNPDPVNVEEHGAGTP